jgi:hypothetical protein
MKLTYYPAPKMKKKKKKKKPKAKAEPKPPPVSRVARVRSTSRGGRGR